MDGFIFAVYMALSYGMPPQIGLAIYSEAESLQWVEAHEIASVVVAEHAADGDFPTDSVSSAGAVGLVQVMNSVRRQYNRDTGSKVKKAELFDWRVNLHVASWELNRVKRVHATKPRCRGKGHHWHAHYLCDFHVRESCKTKWRQRLTKRADRWKWHRDNVNAMASSLACVALARCGARPGKDELALSP